jgi:hypothetical protein
MSCGKTWQRWRSSFYVAPGCWWAVFFLLPSTGHLHIFLPSVNTIDAVRTRVFASFSLSLSLALSHFRSPRSPPFYFCLSVRPSTCVDYDTRTLIHRHRCSLRAYPLVCCSLPALPGTNDGTISQLHFCIHSAQVYAKVSWLFTLSRGGR